MSEVKPGEIVNDVNVEWIAMPVSDYTEAIENKITLRDFFAGCALTAVIREERQYPGAYDYKAREAYKHADAMLKAREV